MILLCYFEQHEQKMFKAFCLCWAAFASQEGNTFL